MMSTFIVEHKYKGKYVMETIAGVEDIDLGMYKDLLGIWVCDTPEEVKAVENELKRIRHARPSQPA
jgi:hypothetical protein